MPLMIALVPVLISIVVFVDTRYAYEVSFEKFKTESTVANLDNKRLILESKIYFLESCRLNPSCPNRSSAESQIEEITRELAAIKSTLDTFNNRTTK